MNHTSPPNALDAPHAAPPMRPSDPRPSRRTALAALTGGAVLAAGAAIPVAALAADHPDRALLDLGHEYEEAKQVEEVARLALDAADDVFYDMTEPPAVLMVSKEDYQLFGFLSATRSKDRSDGFDHEDVEKLRSVPRTKPVWHLFDIKTKVRTETHRHDDFDPYTTELHGSSVPYPEAQARADEIVATWDKHIAAISEAEVATGRLEAHEAYEVATDARLAIVDKIAACHARTLEGLRVRAKIVAQIHSDRDLEPEDGHTTDEVMLWATIRDLAAMST